MKIIQIGANTGNDHVYEFIKTHSDEIEFALLIEPLPFLIGTLTEKYNSFKNVLINQCAITNDESITSMTIYYDTNSTNYEVSSFNIQHLINHGCPIENISSITVSSHTVNHLMELYKLNEIDHLFIDAEGLDVYIIASIDFEKYKFKNITFEYAHTDGTNTTGHNFNEIASYLQSLNYKLTQTDGLNIIATLLDTNENNL